MNRYLNTEYGLLNMTTPEAKKMRSFNLALEQLAKATTPDTKSAFYEYLMKLKQWFSDHRENLQYITYGEFLEHFSQSKPFF